MRLTTKKLDGGQYQIHLDGQPIEIFIARGDAPRWGDKQEWSIGVGAADRSIHWLVNDQQGKALALETVERIIKAAQPQ